MGPDRGTLGPVEKIYVGPELNFQHSKDFEGLSCQKSDRQEISGPINTQPIPVSNINSNLIGPLPDLSPGDNIGSNIGTIVGDSLASSSSLNADLILRQSESVAIQGLGIQAKMSKKMKKRMEKAVFSNFVGDLASPSEQELKSAPTLVSNKHTSELGGKNLDERFRKEAIETWEMGKKMGLTAVGPESEVISEIERIFVRVDGQMVEGKEKDKSVS